MSGILKNPAAGLAAAALKLDPVLSLAHRFTGSCRMRKGPDGSRVFPFLRVDGGNTFQVLIYHRVLTEPDPFIDGVDRAFFTSQMEYLARHASVLDLVEITDRVARGGKLPRWTVAVTFDDGYRDVYDNAYPVLRSLGLPATVFPVTGYMGRGHVLWYDKVFSSFRTTAKNELKDPVSGRVLDLSTPERVEASLHRTLESLKRMPDGERLDRVEEIVGALEPPIDYETAELMLEPEQIKEMAGNGISIGSHTVNHPILTTIGEGRLAEELGRSRETLEGMLGATVDVFAYPNGKADDYDEGVKAALRKAGYRAAVTTVEGTNDSGTDPLEINRVMPWRKEITRFAMQLNWYRFAL